MTFDKNTTVLGVLELSSIAAGITVLDALVKEAPVKIIDARTICPGKYLIVFCGDVASAEYAYKKGLEMSGGHLVDQLLLQQVHHGVLEAIGKINPVNNWDALGVVETKTVTAAIQAADVAAKESNVAIIEVRLAIGFGGKSYMKMSGSLHEVQASFEVAKSSAEHKDALFAASLISSPHHEITPFILK